MKRTDGKAATGFSSVVRVAFFAVAMALTASTAMAAGVGYYYSKLFGEDLPDLGALKSYNPSLATRVYDDSGELIAEFYVEKRILTPIAKIPKPLIYATIAVEDASFYEHHGINFEGILRAFYENIKAGKVVQGGSSITQQVVKVLLLSPERTLSRKMREALLSLEIERSYSKDEILEIYLNQVYYGNGAYGVAAAAETYFGKALADLTIPEIALIAGLPKAPNSYSPYNNPEKARIRRSHVLGRLAAVGYITPEVRDKSAAEPIVLSGRRKPVNKAPWFVEHVRRYLEKQFGVAKLYKGGLKVYTTLDMKLQQSADSSVISGLEQLDKRLGYRGPVGQKKLEKGEKPDWEKLNPRDDPLQSAAEFFRPGRRVKGIVTAVDKGFVKVSLGAAKGVILIANMDWAHKANPNADMMWAPKIEDARKVLKKGDIIEVKTLGKPGPDGAYPLALDQTPDTQSALIALDPRTGAIKAMVGGYDPESTKFNRAVQALRQPGSSFKPVIYTAALDNGFTPATIVVDEPVTFDIALTGFKEWWPMNFEGEFFGPTRIREAVTHSRNVVTVKVLAQIGAQKAIEYARLFGIKSQLEPVLSLGLGSAQVTPEEMVGVYATLANGGVRMNSYFIKQVMDNAGVVIEKNEPYGEQALKPAVAYLMTSILQSVVEEGTAKKVSELGHHIAGKTGTTNSFNDAWFNGFTPDFVCGVWVGRDDNRPIGEKETGARAAIPIWFAFMKEALKNYQSREFEAPEDIVFERIDKKMGLLTDSTGDDSMLEAFIAGTEPTVYAGQTEKPGKDIAKNRDEENSN
jgi:penicillin-binding protein 1A